MPDIGPNIGLNKKRLEVHRFEMQLSLQRMELRKLEQEDEFAKMEANRLATIKAIADIDEQLKNIREA
jgi:hypothetical protein